MMARLSRLVMIALVWCVPLGATAQQPASAPVIKRGATRADTGRHFFNLTPISPC